MACVVVGFFLLFLRLDLTGDRVGMGSLIYCMEVIARAVSGMRYGPTGSRYRPTEIVIMS